MKILQIGGNSSKKLYYKLSIELAIQPPSLRSKTILHSRSVKYLGL